MLTNYMGNSYTGEFAYMESTHIESPIVLWVLDKYYCLEQWFSTLFAACTPPSFQDYLPKTCIQNNIHIIEYYDSLSLAICDHNSDPLRS